MDRFGVADRLRRGADDLEHRRRWCTALARTPLQFGLCRALLGLGEAGNFPAAIKGVAEWFPKKERAFATGIFNAGTNVGAVVAPLTVPWIAINLGLAVGVHR